MSKEKLETRIQKKNKLDLEEIGMSTIGYGIAGAIFAPNNEVGAALGAIVGFSLETYGQIKRYDLDLWALGLPGIVGGLIGSFFFEINNNEFISDIMIYAGALTGVGLGVYNFHINEDK